MTLNLRKDYLSNLLDQKPTVYKKQIIQPPAGSMSAPTIIPPLTIPSLNVSIISKNNSHKKPIIDLCQVGRMIWSFDQATICVWSTEFELLLLLLLLLLLFSIYYLLLLLL